MTNHTRQYHYQADNSYASDPFHCHRHRLARLFWFHQGHLNECATGQKNLESQLRIAIEQRLDTSSRYLKAIWGTFPRPKNICQQTVEYDVNVCLQNNYLDDRGNLIHPKNAVNRHTGRLRVFFHKV